MMDQATATILTRQIQLALAAGDEAKAKRLSTRKRFKDFCGMLGVSPDQALAAIRTSMGPIKGGSDNGLE